MSEGQKKIVVQLKVSHGENPIRVIDSLFANTDKPDLVFLDLSSIEYPHRTMDLPWELVEYAGKNPKVKFMWDGNNPLPKDEDCYEIVSCNNKNIIAKDFIEKRISFKPHEYLDMTMVSVFYDAGINELRKVATRKAVSHWIEQYHLPKEMMFIELGFNGVFTFSKEDFPKQIDYIRIDGNDSHKYLFQKEHLWNMAARHAKCEKLMFVDSDIAPLKDVDWFKKVYDALDKCLFTQGFYSITYLDENDSKTKKKMSFTQTNLDSYSNGTLNTYAPGGVFCIEKSLLQSIGYFNYLPFGGGDFLFWSELLNSDNAELWFTSLVKRDYVKSAFAFAGKLSNKKQVDTVYVDTFHFFHGNLSNRSYHQRDYILATQYPWMDRIIFEDECGLLSWANVNHYFHDVAKNFCHIQNDEKRAHELMKRNFNYSGFFSFFKKFIGETKSLSKHQLVNEIQRKILEYGMQPQTYPTQKNSEFHKSYYSLNEKFNNIDEKIILTMTSYPGRINGVLNCVKMLFENTIKPDRLVLNLSSEEFPNKEKDLPSELVEYRNRERNFEIYWVDDNTKPYKKTIPTLRRFPSDVIISVDDDINYPANFIQILWDYYVIYGKQCPITAGGSRWENDAFSHYGGFSLIKREFFGDYLDDLYENLVLPNIDDFPFADPIITYASLLNGKRYKFTVGFDMRQIRMVTHDQNTSISKLGTSDYKRRMEKEISLIEKYIYGKYHKTYDDLFDAKINVNYTTYPLRDKYLYESLKSLQKQTVKPDNIFLWLSEDEYDKHHLPDTIQRCLDANLLTEIKWLPKNIYCHKRHDCFVQRNAEYNLDLDDDIRYKENFIEEIVSDSKKHQNCITTLASNKMLYNGTTLVKKPVSQKVSIKNNYMGGRTCFPPYLIPVGYFYDKKLNSLRDMYVPKCDEAWIRGLALKFNIMVNAIYSWKFYKFDTIEETQDTALFNENKQMTKYGIREKERNFFNAIKIFNVEDVAKEIWPSISIDNYKLLV